MRYLVTVGPYVPEVLILVLVATLAQSVFGLFRRYVNTQASAQFALFAAANGMEWRNGQDRSVLALPFDFLRQGDGRGVDDVMAGTWKGLSIEAAHYWYYDQGDRGNRTYHHFTILATALPLQVPYLGIQQQNVLTQAAELIGMTGLQFESEEFNRQYKVVAKERPFAYQVIDTSMISWLLGPGAGFNFALNDRYLLMWVHRIMDPQGLGPLFNAARGFVDTIPQLVWQEYGNRPPTVTQQAS